MPLRSPIAARPRIALVVCLAIALSPAAAPAQMAFDVWTIEHGLPQNSVNDIHQTRDGYLWLATYGGLVRFDGVRFTVFDRRTDGVGSVRTRALHEDAAGTLWAGTDDGMLIRYRDGRFTTFDAEDGLPAGIVLRIDSDLAGGIWITWIDVVTRYDGRQFVTYRPGDLPRDVRPRGRPLFHRSAAALWWSEDAAGIHCLFRGRVDLCLAAEHLPADEVTGVTTDQRGAIWIHTAAAGVVRRSDGQVRHFTARDGLPRLLPEGVPFEARDGTLWFRQLFGRLRWIRNGTGVVIELDDVLTVHEDVEGSLWVGTAAAGLQRARHRAISMLMRDRGLSSNNVYAILRDRRGETWVGTWGGGLNRLSGDAVEHFRAADGLPSDRVTAVFEDRSGVLVGTDAGLAVIAGGRISRYSDPMGWLAGNVWAIHDDEDGVRWFGTDAGLVRQIGREFVRYTSADGLTDNRVTALLGGTGGVLWIGTSRGLTRLKDGAFTTYTERDGLIGNHVRALLEDQDALWIGTYDGGLYRLREGRLTRYTTADGLHDNGVFQILDDGLGYFWMGSNRGLSRLSRQELQSFAEGRLRTVRPTVFGVKDGLASPEANGGRQPSGLRMPDGTLWMPTQGGVAIVSPARVRANPHAPPVHIEDVRVAGARFASFTSGVEMPADRNSFEIDYTALSFVKADQVRFRYRLAGLDDEWVEAGARRSAAYHRIPPGRYRFEVIAANSDGVWNTGGDSVAIVVLAPFWRQTWFLGLLLALVGAAGLVVERRRIGRFRREYARQQAYARQLLETQERERRRISHELHDSLGQMLFLIRQRARTAGEDAAGSGAAPALGEISGLATRAYDEMKEIAYDLRPYQLEKIGLTRTIEGMLGRVSRACGLPIEADLDDIDDLFADDARINVYRIVQEGVSNVVRHARATTARVSIWRIDRRAVIEIRDNGVGFGATDRRRREPSASFGLTNLEERARALGGTLEVISRPGGGTALRIALAPKEDHGG